MKCWIKLAGVIVLLSLISIDIFFHIVKEFESPVYVAGHDTGGQSIWTMLQGLSTIAQGLSAIVVALFTFLLMRISGGQLTAAKDNAAAARNAAEAAATQARVAEQTITSLERPHLFTMCSHNFLRVLLPLKSFRTLYPHPTSGFPSATELSPLVMFCFKNYGKTPAIIRQVAAIIVIGSSEPPPDVPNRCDLPQESVLLPGEKTGDIRGEIRPYSNFSVTKEKFDALLSGETYWWFYGFVTYEDIIDTEHTHYFCLRFDYRIDTFEPYPLDRNYTERLRIEKKIPDNAPSKGSLRLRPSDISD